MRVFSGSRDHATRPANYQDMKRSFAPLRLALAVSLYVPLATGCDSEDDPEAMSSGTMGSGASDPADVCEEATEYYLGCGLEPQGTEQACEGEVECSAHCVLDATCEELEEATDPAVFLGGGNDYTMCILDCAEE